jgi:hypothetical protein
MQVDEQPVCFSAGGQAMTVPTLGSSWRGGGGVGPIGSARAFAETLLVPLYHKIRIPFGVVHDQVLEFDAILKVLVQQGGGLLTEPDGLEWDIYLTNVNDLKRETLESDRQPIGGRLAVLTEGMPRFLWRATAFSGQDIALDLLFDATDIEQGDVFVRAVEYDVQLSRFLRQVAQSGVAYQAFGRAAPILRWFGR